jgi:predicted DNA-binding transcriptional regulator AlpA
MTPFIGICFRSLKGFPDLGREVEIMANKMERRLLNIKEVAARLGIAPQTVYNGISHKSSKPFPIRAKRWGRKVLFDSRDVDRFIDSMPYAEALDAVSSADKKTPTENTELQRGN